MITSPLLRYNVLPGTKQRPLVLKWRVASSREMQAPPVCLPDMYSVFNCWEKSDFDDDMCKNEIVRFMHCVEVETARRDEEIKLKKKLQLGQEGRLSKDQINALFKRHLGPK